MNLPYFHPEITAALRRFKYITLPLQRLILEMAAIHISSLMHPGKLCSSFSILAALTRAHVCGAAYVREIKCNGRREATEKRTRRQ